jgi:pilus assembly protein Flp/PilA
MMIEMGRGLSITQAVLADLHGEDSGQDLIEYALIGALIGLSAVVGMGSVATALNDIFSSVGAKIQAYAS